MGREIVYCDQCGDRITASDFDKGLAREVQNRNYCRKCVKESPTSGSPSQAQSPPSSRPPTRTSRRQQKLDTRRLATVKPPASKRYQLAVIFGITAVVLALTIFLAWLMFRR